MDRWVMGLLWSLVKYNYGLPRERRGKVMVYFLKKDDIYKDMKAFCR